MGVEITPEMYFFKYVNIHTGAHYVARCKDHAYYLHSGWNNVFPSEYYRRPDVWGFVECDVCVKLARTELLKDDSFEWWEDLELDDRTDSVDCKVCKKRR